MDLNKNKINQLFVVACAGISTLFISCGQMSDQGRKDESKILLVDTHNDVLSGTVLKGLDISNRLDTGNTDLARLKEGGVDVQIFAVFGDGKHVGKPGFDYANRQIDSFYAVEARNRDKMGVARTADEARALIADGKMAGMIALEGGHMLDDNLDNLDSLSRRGIVYMTLTWNNSNSICTSSADEKDPDKAGEAKGLTDFGREVIARLNALGVAIDLSHVGEKAFYEVIETSTLPVMASHSNAKELCDVHRNLTDDQIRAIANTNGVVCVTFYAPFVDGSYYARIERAMEAHPEVLASLREKGLHHRDQLIPAFLATMPQLAEDLSVSIGQLVDHIDHIVEVAGIDYVGIGSDFFGLSNSAYPKGLTDASTYPRLIDALFERGYSEEDVRKIAGENVLRVLAANSSAKTIPPSPRF